MPIPFRSLALGLVLAVVVRAARADLVVTGTRDQADIEASGAPIVEVLEALKKQFGIIYRYHVRPNWTVDGAFTGSLSSILPRIFRDRNYILRIGADRSMTIFLPSLQGPPSGTPIPPPVQAFGRQPLDQSDPSDKASQ